MTDPDLLLAVLTFFVFLCAVAMCVQAGMLFGIWKAAKSLQKETQSVMPQVRTILTKAETTLEQSRQNIVDVTAKANEISARAQELAVKANEIMEIGKAQMVKVDAVVTDAAGRAKVQLERAELVVDDTMSRVNQTVTAVHEGVLRPVREIQAIATGIRTAVDHMLRGGRPNVSEATQQDELFI
jgi:hypothetical protein